MTKKWIGWLAFCLLLGLELSLVYAAPDEGMNPATSACMIILGIFMIVALLVAIAPNRVTIWTQEEHEPKISSKKQRRLIRLNRELEQF